MKTRHRTAQQVVKDLRKGRSSVNLEDIWVTFKSKKRSDVKFTKLPSAVKHKQIRSFRFEDGTVAWDKQDITLDLLFNARNIKENDYNKSSRSLKSQDSQHDGLQIQPQEQNQMEEKKEVVELDKKEPPDDSSKEDESLLTTHRPVHPVRGLKNMGNTCYYNSVVQNIVETIPLLDALESEKGHDEYPISNALVRTVNEMVKSEKDGKMFIPNQLLGAIAQTNKQFKGWKQQDSHELLRALLEGIRGDSKKADRDAQRKIVREKVSGWDDGIVSAWLSSINVELDTEVELSNEELVEVLKAKSLNLKKVEFQTLVTKLGLKTSTPEPRKKGKKKKSTKVKSNEEKLLIALKLLRKGECAFYKTQLEACESGEESVETKDDEDESKDKFRPKDVTDLVFGGVLESTVTCRTCSKVSSVYEWFHDLSLPIVSGIEYSQPAQRTQQWSRKKQRKRNKKRRRKNQQHLSPPPPSIKRKVVKADPDARGEARLRPGKITVENAFAAFTDSEVLKGDNSYGCENCATLAMCGSLPAVFESQDDVGKVPPLEEDSPSHNVEETTKEEHSDDPRMERHIPQESKKDPIAELDALPCKRGSDLERNDEDNHYDIKSCPIAEDSKALPLTEPMRISIIPPGPRGKEVEEKIEDDRSEAKPDDSPSAYEDPMEFGSDRAKFCDNQQAAINTTDAFLEGSHMAYRDPYVGLMGDQGLNVADVGQCHTPSGSGDDSTDQNIPISQSIPNCDLTSELKNRNSTVEPSTSDYEDEPLQQTEFFDSNIQPNLFSDQSSCGTLDEAATAKASSESKTAMWINQLDSEYCQLLRKYIEKHQSSESAERKAGDDIVHTGSDEQKHDLSQLQIYHIEQKQLFSDLKTKFNIQMHQTAELMLWFTTTTAKLGNDKGDKDVLDGESRESSELPTPAASEPPSLPMVKREADKALRVARPPKVLTVHLKRFQQNFNGRLTKTSKDVEFGNLLDITPYCTEEARQKYPMIYQLFGLVVHSGSMTGGHYVAYVRKRPIRGTPAWYYFSDSVHKRLSSFAQVKKQQAYILFYQQVPPEVNK